MILSYLLQENISVELHLIQMLLQFSLQLDETGAGGRFHILNLDIVDGARDVAITLL